MPISPRLRMLADASGSAVCREYAGRCRCAVCESPALAGRGVPCGQSAESCAPRAESTARRFGRRRQTSPPTSPVRGGRHPSTHQSAVVGLVVWWLVCPPALAAPTPRQSQWNNPCAIDEALMKGGGTSISGASDAEILDRIIHLNRVVRPKVDDIMDVFVRSTYNVDEEAMMRDWGHHNVSWLGFVHVTIARQQGGGALSLEEALPIHFADLQRIAVVFERMTLDAAVSGDLNLDAFRRLQADLMQLLCELHIAMLEKQLRPKGTVTADFMGDGDRALDISRERNLRNWITIREYKRYISHLDEVMRTLRNQPSAG